MKGRFVTIFIKRRNLLNLSHFVISLVAPCNKKSCCTYLFMITYLKKKLGRLKIYLLKTQKSLSAGRWILFLPSWCSWKGRNKQWKTWGNPGSSDSLFEKNPKLFEQQLFFSNSLKDLVRKGKIMGIPVETVDISSDVHRSLRDQFVSLIVTQEKGSVLSRLSTLIGSNWSQQRSCVSVLSLLYTTIVFNSQARHFNVLPQGRFAALFCITKPLLPRQILLHISWFFKQKLTPPLYQHDPNSLLIKERRKGENLSLKSLLWMSEQPFAIHFLLVSCNVCPVAIPENCAQTLGSEYWQRVPGPPSPPPPHLNLAPLEPVNSRLGPQTHPFALKLVYWPAKIFGSEKLIFLKVEDSKSLATGRCRVGLSPLFNFFF